MPEMQPEDVPDELMLAADAALQSAASRSGDSMFDLDDGLRVVLAAVLPRHERMIRSALAARLRAASALASPDEEFAGSGSEYASAVGVAAGLWEAARLVMLPSSEADDDE